MATVNFLYRSTKDNAPLNVRLLFRYNDKDFVIAARSELAIYSYKEIAANAKLNAKQYWTELHSKKNVRDIDLSNKQVEINGKLNVLKNHILQAFDESEITAIVNDKDWLKNTLEQFYRPINDNSPIPSDLIPFFDYYILKRRNELGKNNLKTISVTRNKLEKFETSRGVKLKVSGISEKFKNEFVDFCNEYQYSQNTQQKDLKIVKTVCRYAKYLGLETHTQMDNVKLLKEPSTSIYLTTEDLEKIKKLTITKEYLDNARDWLLISCYTGQRVSDFMRFKEEMLREEDGKHLLEFIQVKTKKRMVIPVSKQVREILKKRKGKFPRATSDQKYNEYIKLVCELAEIKEIVKGKKRVSIAAKGLKPTKSDYRDVLGKFEKWELVSSHIGRRSFATNHYGKIPTTFLIHITGHSTEKQFLSYIKKSNKDLAMESYDYFN